MSSGRRRRIKGNPYMRLSYQMLRIIGTDEVEIDEASAYIKYYEEEMKAMGGK